jgi:hypothetical protein
MFQQFEREFSPVRWIGQLLIVYCVPTLLVGLVEILFRGADSPILQAFTYPIIGSIGASAGMGIHRMSPDAAREGLWVWVLPTAVFAVAMVYGIFSGAGSLLDIVYAAPGDSNPIPVLQTLPTWGCICYSAAIYWSRHRPRAPLSFG